MNTQTLTTALVEPLTLERLLRRPSGRSLIELFLKEAQGLVSALREAVARDEAQVCREMAHSLKGSCSYIGARGLQTLSAELEGLARSGQLPATAPVLVSQIEDEYERVRQMLNAHL
jgi:HPt (histidine-containing phosphotransfer) domain-containing protein